MNKPLRIEFPTMYEVMIKAIEPYHIHPHDIYATANKQGDHVEITLQYSDAFSQQMSICVHHERVVRPDDEVREFFRETAEQCKKQLIADYYKMSKP